MRILGGIDHIMYALRFIDTVNHFMGGFICRNAVDDAGDEGNKMNMRKDKKIKRCSGKKENW